MQLFKTSACRKAGKRGGTIQEAAAEAAPFVCVGQPAPRVAVIRRVPL